MKNVLKIISMLGLALTILPSIFLFTNQIGMDSMKWNMGIGMVLWMVSAPFWINKKTEDGRLEREEEKYQ